MTEKEITALEQQKRQEIDRGVEREIDLIQGARAPSSGFAQQEEQAITQQAEADVRAGQAEAAKFGREQKKRAESLTRKMTLDIKDESQKTLQARELEQLRQEVAAAISQWTMDIAASIEGWKKECEEKREAAATEWGQALADVAAERNHLLALYAEKLRALNAEASSRQATTEEETEQETTTAEEVLSKSVAMSEIGLKQACREALTEACNSEAEMAAWAKGRIDVIALSASEGAAARGRGISESIQREMEQRATRWEALPLEDPIAEVETMGVPVLVGISGESFGDFGGVAKQSIDEVVAHYRAEIGRIQQSLKENVDGAEERHRHSLAGIKQEFEERTKAIRLALEENARRNAHDALLHRLALREDVGGKLLEIAARESALAMTLKDALAPVAALEILAARPEVGKLLALDTPAASSVGFLEVSDKSGDF